MAAVKPSQTPLHKTFESFLTERRYEVGNLPGNLSYKSVYLEKGRMTKVPPCVTLAHQPYRHVDHLEFMNVAEVHEFVKEWQVNQHMVTQRCGWMYGYYVEDPNYEGGYRAVVEGIYEPPQSCVNDNAVLAQNDDFLTVVDALADSLNLERLGFIYTTLARDSAHLMNSREVIRAAKMQLSHESREHYTKYAISKFCTCITHPDMSSGGATPQTDVFMVSDQLCAMVRDGLIDPKEDSHTDPKFVKQRMAMSGEMQPQVLEAGKSVKTEFDPDWFVVKINSGAPVRPRSIFVHSHFPRENRNSVIQLRSDVKKYLSGCVFGEPSWSKLSDFHLLLYLAKILDLDTARVICNSVRERTEVPIELLELVQAIGDS